MGGGGAEAGRGDVEEGERRRVGVGDVVVASEELTTDVDEEIAVGFRHLVHRPDQSRRVLFVLEPEMHFAKLFVAELQLIDELRDGRALLVLDVLIRPRERAHELEEVLFLGGGEVVKHGRSLPAPPHRRNQIHEQEGAGESARGIKTLPSRSRGQSDNRPQRSRCGTVTFYGPGRCGSLGVAKKAVGFRLAVDRR